MNCIIIDDEIVSRILVEKFIKKIKFLNLIATYSNAVDAINNIDSNIDLIFLDIEMPEISGIEFIKNFNNLPQIIIISAQDKYAIEAIEFDVTDYLLKPIAFPRFLKAVNKAKEKKKSSKKITANDGLFIKDNSSTLVRIKYDEIVWVESLENYVVINTEKTKFTIHFTMKSLEKQLPSEIFSRIHRSYIINHTKIKSIEDNDAIVLHRNKNKKFPIAKTYKEDLLNKIHIVINK